MYRTILSNYPVLMPAAYIDDITKLLFTQTRKHQPHHEPHQLLSPKSPPTLYPRRRHLLAHCWHRSGMDRIWHTRTLPTPKHHESPKHLKFITPVAGQPYPGIVGERLAHTSSANDSLMNRGALWRAHDRRCARMIAVVVCVVVRGLPREG